MRKARNMFSGFNFWQNDEQDRQAAEVERQIEVLKVVSATEYAAGAVRRQTEQARKQTIMEELKARSLRDRLRY